MRACVCKGLGGDRHTCACMCVRHSELGKQGNIGAMQGGEAGQDLG